MADQPAAGPGDALDASVVIPVYNGQEVLADQLAALAAQTYVGAFEVVVADNGSTDESRQVARAFSNALPALKLVDASAVRGPSHARNVGARQSAGRLLLFCDADDVVSPRWVEAMVAASTTADLMAGSGEETLDPIRVAGSPPLQGPAPGSFRFLPWHRSSNLAAHRDVFEQVGGFDEDRRIAEDVDFCWRVQLAGYRFRFVPEAFVAYRRRPDMREAARRQFAFGLAAAPLYDDFRADGAPPPSWKWVLGDAGRVALGAPTAAFDGRRRERWCLQIAGVSGRAVGLYRLRRPRS